MALQDWVQGARRPSPSITWTDADGTVIDLTGATITAVIRDRTGLGRTADGVCVVTNGAGGVFRWDLGVADVATAGRFTVQFNAAFGSGPTPARTFAAEWRIEKYG